MIKVHLFLLTNNTAKQYASSYTPKPFETKRIFNRKFNYLFYIIFTSCFCRSKKHLIFHDLPSKFGLILVSLLKLPNYSWVIWGNDLYTLFQENQRAAKKFLRKCSVVYGFKEDFIKLKSLQPLISTQEFHYVPPTVQTFTSEHSGLRALKESKAILLGHSCSKGNNLMTMPFDDLKKLDYKYYLILSYGCTRDRAKYLKGSLSSMLVSIDFIENYMDLNDFIIWLSENISALYLFNDRQAAVGNIAICLLLGIPVFMKENVAPFALFNSIGAGVYSLDNIHKMNHLSLPVESEKFLHYYYDRLVE